MLKDHPGGLSGIVFAKSKHITSRNSEYDQEIPQSQTADNPVAPRSSCIDKLALCQNWTLLLRNNGHLIKCMCL